MIFYLVNLLEVIGEDLVAQALCIFTFCTRLRSAVVAGAAGPGHGPASTRPATAGAEKL